MNPFLEFLLSRVYDGIGLHPEHLADLRKSGLSDETILAHTFRSVPPSMLDRLLDFEIPSVTSAYILPFHDPRGGFMQHTRLKVFPPIETKNGTIRYLQPRGSGCRLYFPLPTMSMLRGDGRVLFVEGEKKALAAAQLGLAAVGFCGIYSWRLKGSRELIDDFGLLTLNGRVVELVPDGDVATNPDVERGAVQFAEALERRGARVRLVRLPVGIPA